MIGRVRDRRTFEELRRSGRRARRGPITVVHLPGDSEPVRVAFGVGRAVGSAVVRNKVRRRLRHIMRDMNRGDRNLPLGTYLLVARPAVVGMPYGDLEHLVEAACLEAAR